MNDAAPIYESMEGRWVFGNLDPLSAAWCCPIGLAGLGRGSAFGIAYSSAKARQVLYEAVGLRQNPVAWG